MIIALDSGLATCGAAVFTGAGELLDADVFKSERGDKPKKLVGSWSSHDRARRVFELLDWLDGLYPDLRAYDFDLVVEGLGSAKSGDAAFQMAAAAGAIAGWSRTNGARQLCHCTSLEWRKVLGWTATKAPNGATPKERRALKKLDDERLYGLVRALPDGDRVDSLVVGKHRRRPSDTHHALDAFGIGRWFLQRPNATSR